MQKCHFQSFHGVKLNLYDVKLLGLGREVFHSLKKSFNGNETDESISL